VGKHTVQELTNRYVAMTHLRAVIINVAKCNISETAFNEFELACRKVIDELKLEADKNE